MMRYTCGDFSNIGFAKFWDYPTRARQCTENLGFLDDVLKDFLGVEPGIVSNEFVDGAQISFSWSRPDHHLSIPRLSSSLVVRCP